MVPSLISAVTMEKTSDELQEVLESTNHWFIVSEATSWTHALLLMNAQIHSILIEIRTLNDSRASYLWSGSFLLVCAYSESDYSNREWNLWCSWIPMQLVFVFKIKSSILRNSLVMSENIIRRENGTEQNSHPLPASANKTWWPSLPWLHLKSHN